MALAVMILGLILCGIIKLFDEVSGSLNDPNEREKARKNGWKTYTSHNGERLVDTNRHVMKVYDDSKGKHELVLKDYETGEIVHNYNEARRNDAIEKSKMKAQQKGYSTYEIPWQAKKKEDANKYIYIDFATGREYRVRSVTVVYTINKKKVDKHSNMMYFYMPELREKFYVKMQEILKDKIKEDNRIRIKFNEEIRQKALKGIKYAGGKYFDLIPDDAEFKCTKLIYENNKKVYIECDPLDEAMNDIYIYTIHSEVIYISDKTDVQFKFSHSDILDIVKSLDIYDVMLHRGYYIDAITGKLVRPTDRSLFIQEWEKKISEAAEKYRTDNSLTEETDTGSWDSGASKRHKYIKEYKRFRYLNDDEIIKKFNFRVKNDINVGLITLNDLIDHSNGLAHPMDSSISNDEEDYQKDLKYVKYLA